MYIQGSAIDKKFKGSLEHQAQLIGEAIAEHFGDSPVSVLATQAKHAFVVDGSGSILKVSYKVEGKEVKVTRAKKTDEIPVIEDKDVPRFVSDQLRSLAEAVMSGKPMERTQVRELAQLIDKDEAYWVSDVIEGIDEAVENGTWFGMYEANQEQIRTTMYGRIREIESPFTSTKFSKIAPSKLSKFEGELREAVSVLSGLVNKVVDECSGMVFDQDQDDFFSAICESLKVEAQAIGGLLGKAEKLMRSDDVGRVAEAHDRLAVRAKTMAVVTEYMKTRSQPTGDEE